MIIVDDKLSLDVLGGRLDIAQPAATTWGFHCRLVRALRDIDRWSSLTQAARAQALLTVSNPPSARLQVLDPREVTDEAAVLAVRHGLNLLAAELFASAVHYRAEIYLSEPNVGRRWPEIVEAEGITLTVA